MATIALFGADALVFAVIRAPDDVEDPATFAASLGLECSAARFTSYNANFGGHYAAIGDSFNEGMGIYVAPKPFPSWLLDESTGYWNPPVPMPDDCEEYEWGEASLSWKIVPQLPSEEATEPAE